MPTDSRTSVGRHLQRRTGHRGVRHPPRVLDQRLHPAERLGEDEDLGPLADPQRRLLAAAQREGHHPAEAAHLLGRDLVPGVVRQPRVVDPVDRRVREQHLGDALRVRAVPVHPDAEGLDPAQHQPGSRTARHRAHRVLVEGRAARPGPRRRRPARRRSRRSARPGTSSSSARPRPRRARAAAAGTARRRCCRPRAARRRRGRARPAPAMSAMPSSGLVGVSHQSTLVLGRSAARTASRSARCTGVASTPHRLQHLREEPVACRRTRRPGRRRGRRARSTVRSRQSSAASPEAKASPRRAALQRGQALLQRGPGRVRRRGCTRSRRAGRRRRPA